MSDGGKGSRPRPFSISQAEYDARWDTIFRRDGLDEDQKKEVDNPQENKYNTETEKD